MFPNALRRCLLVFFCIFAGALLVSNVALLQSNDSAKEIALQTENAILSFSNSAPVVISDGTVATPYPSEINVTGVSGTIQKLTVTLNDLQHSFPDDADILLVGPNGQSVVLMSDAGGGNNLTGVTITLDDAAAEALPDAEIILSGSYKPTNFEANDIFPAPAPNQPHSSSLAIFNGADPNGIWRLYVVDDTGRDAGILANGWTLTINNGISGQNLDSINIPEAGVGSIYPSSLRINNLSGAVTSVKVILNNFNHNLPDDVDILLVAPNGRSVVLMSDVGGNTPVSNVTLTLDDSAANFLPDNGALTSGRFKPTNSGGGDVFPPPAPNAAPSGGALAAFNGSIPNGTWSLYLVDDTGANAGSLAGGWSLSLTTSIALCPLTISPDFLPIDSNGGTGSLSISTSGGCEWNASVQPIYDYINITSAASGEGNATVTFSVNPNTNDDRTGFIQVSNNTVTRLLRIQQGSGCPIALGQTSQSFPARGGLGSVTVSASNTCLWQVSSSESWLVIESAANGVIGNSIVTFRLLPNPTVQPRSGTITIGARTLTVTQAGASGCPYALENYSQYFSAAGGNNSFGVLAANNCNWTATTNVNWVTISNPSGSGNGSISINVAPNPNSVSRSGAITIGGETFSIVQGRSNIPAPFNFDNDNKSDIGVFRPSDGVWYVLRSSNSTASAVQFGVSTDIIVPADYDGDRKTDVAVFRNGSWYILNSGDGTFRSLLWGVSGDVTAPADYDGDGKADVAIWRPALASWYVLLSSNGGVATQQFGAVTDTPVSGDFDGDGKSDFVLYRTSDIEGSPSIWFLRYSTNPSVTVVQQFGVGEDLPVAADYDGDGRTNMAVFRPSLGTWYRSTDPARAFDNQVWGAGDDALVQGDYDGDGKIDVGVFRGGSWYLLNTSNGASQAVQWGLGTDIPISSSYKPFVP